MAKFEESRPSHEVHEVSRPMGHGYHDQKHAKGMRSPALSSVPTADAGTVGGAGGAGSPGEAGAEYGGGSVTGS